VSAPYTTCTLLPSSCPWLYLTGLHQSPPSHVTVYSKFGQVILDVTTLHHTTFSPHISLYNYIRIRTHQVSNLQVIVISPDNLHAHISCCFVTVISPRNLCPHRAPRGHVLASQVCIYYWPHSLELKVPIYHVGRFNLSRSQERAPSLLPRHCELDKLHPIVWL
jgi:hypothetical protein